ncbi:MAG TPA: potassium-transporting ATPase subunit KdpC [Myxococcota bacterium]|nr:potassium-transporting ATPase subunit KdpC [Myxococcota bacterium]
MLRELRTACLVLLALTGVTGVAYPLFVTGLAQLLFPRQANGSLLEADGRVVGSALIGQPFEAPGYFWSRPSATASFPYDGAASAGSNLGPTSDALRDAVRTRALALRAADPGNEAPVPVDLVTASGSGLDPHISPAAARYQAARVARVRGLDPGRVEALVALHTEGRFLGLLGEPRVNVLALNLALDRAAPR